MKPKTPKGRKSKKRESKAWPPSKAEARRAEKAEARVTREFTKRLQGASKANGKRAPLARLEGGAGKRKRKAPEPGFVAKARGQVTLEGTELPPMPAVSIEEREIIQRIATTSHFRASLDAEAVDEVRTAATFLQRRSIVRDRMKALPKVEDIPAGAKDAECDEIVRAFERKFMLKDVPWDLEAAKRSEPVTREVPVRVIQRPVAPEPLWFEPCPACKGEASVPSGCEDPKCGTPLYIHACGLGQRAPCKTCNETGGVPCRGCNGHGEVEWTPEGSTKPTAVACGKCRPAEHAVDTKEASA